MSSVIETVENVVVENVSIETKEKKPTLSAKLEKYMVFGYWFLEHLHDTETINDEKFVELKEELRMYSSLDEQIDFYEKFLDDSKITTKEMKGDIRSFFKPKKEKKAKVPKDPNAVEKRGRKKKEIVTEPVDPLVAEMVAIANGEEPVVTVAVEEKPKRKYNKKPKAPVEVAVEVPLPSEVAAPEEVAVEVPLPAEVVVASQTEVAAPVQEKPKRKYNKKPKAQVEGSETEQAPQEQVLTEAEPAQVEQVQVTTPAQVESDKKTKKTKEPKEKKAKEPKEKKVKATKKDEPVVAPVVAPVEVESEEIEEVDGDYSEVTTRELIFKGISYLIDDENVVYTLDQDQIGVYNSETEEIEFDME